MAPGPLAWSRPTIVALARGRFGVRSPSNQGRTTTPPDGVTSARSMPNQPATLSTASVQLRTHARGRKAPVASANPATTPDPSAVRSMADEIGRPRGAEADDGLARPQAQAERRGHVVARARADEHVGRQPELRGGVGPHPADRLARPRDFGQHRLVERDRGQGEHVGGIALRRRRPPAGPRRVAPVGHPPAAQPLGEVVVGQADGSGGLGGTPLRAPQPRPAGHGDRRDGHAPGALGPGVGAPGRDERLGIGGGSRVVPEDRRADRPAPRVEGHQAVLLGRDRDGRDVARATGLVEGVAQGGPPRLGVALARSGRSGHLVEGPPAGDPTPGLRIDEHDLRRLGRAVDPRHQPAPPFGHGLPFERLVPGRPRARKQERAGRDSLHSMTNPWGIIPGVTTTGAAPAAPSATRAGPAVIAP